MADILFTHSYFLRYDPKQWATGMLYAPLGTLYAAAVMREKSHNVKLFDTMFCESPSELIPRLNTRPKYFVIYDDGFNYLTKMCLTNMRDAAFQMIKYAKENNCITIISSSDSTDQFDLYLDQGADFILLGEAELTLAALIDCIEQKQEPLTTIAGIAYRYQDATIKTVKRDVIKELDKLPMPAWDLINMEPYRKIWLKKKGYFSMNIATTRGCPFKCNWCAKPIYGNRYNTRSPLHVVKELKFLKQHYSFDHIWFCDDIFGLKPGWVKEFANLVAKESLSFKFKIQARVDLMLQEDYVKDLARAGCENTWMGAESGSQKILDAMDKGTKVEQIYSATRLLKKNGIHPSFFIQFGYPGETRRDIEKTIRMINDLLPHEIGISVSYPLPGTKFFENVKSQLQHKTNWTDSDELALLFRNNYSPAFYKQLHRYVHKTYRKNLAIDQIKSLLSKPSSFKISGLKKAVSFIYYLPASWMAKFRLSKLEIPQI